MKKALVIFGVLLLVAVGVAHHYAGQAAALVGGFTSRTLCTNVLMLGRDRAEVEALDISYDQRRFTTSRIRDNLVDTLVTIGPFSFKHTSVYRPGLGCANLAGWSFDEAMAIGVKGPLPEKSTSEVLSAVAGDLPGVDRQRLDAVVEAAFSETTDDVYQRQNTRAVLVHHRGKLIAERYAQGFTADTPLRGMSMTKSATATLVGILAGQGRLDVDQLAPLDEWAGHDGPHGRVTLDHLLKMTAGFDYSEGYESDPLGLVNRMLLATADMAAFAAEVPLVGEPGESWDYQTTHSVLLQKVIRNTIGDDQAYFRFPQQALFNKLGMSNSFFQADASGTYTGGALMYGSGRDWLKLGLLYLNEGVHNGERILPEGWVEYATTPSAASMKKRAYGAQIWLNAPSPTQLFPGIPEDAYAFQGHYGQYVIVIPSLDLVAVRLGMTFADENGFDKQAFIRGVVSSLDVAAGAQ